MDRHINHTKKFRILIVVCSLAVFACSVYFTNISTILAAPSGTQVGFKIPFTNVPVPLVNHYRINNDCQLVHAEFNDPNIGLNYQDFGSNVHQQFGQLLKQELQKNPGIASNEVMFKSFQNKILKQAFNTEIQKLENSFELNPSFEKEFTNDYFYSNTHDGYDLTPEMIQEYDLSPPTGPTQEQIQNDPDCSMYKSIKNSNGGH